MKCYSITDFAYQIINMQNKITVLESMNKKLQVIEKKYNEFINNINERSNINLQLIKTGVLSDSNIEKVKEEAKK